MQTDDRDDGTDDTVPDLFSEDASRRLQKNAQPIRRIRGRLLPPYNRFTGTRDFTQPQRQLIASHKRGSLYCGGIGAGKTVAGAYAMLVPALTSEHETSMVAAPIGAQLSSNIYPLVRQILREFREFNGYQLERRWNMTDKYLELINGHRILFRTMSAPDSLRGPSLTSWWGDEISSVEDITGVSEERVLDIVLGRMRGGAHSSRIREIWTTTPKGDQGVVSYYLRELQNKSPHMELIRASTLTNPALPIEYIEALKRKYSERMWKQEVLGEVLDFSGAYFGDVVDRQGSFVKFALDRTAPVHICIDWGDRYPVAVFVQELASDDGIQHCVFACTEAVGNAELIDKCFAMLARWGVHQAEWYPDPADPGALNLLRRKISLNAKTILCPNGGPIYTRSKSRTGFSHTLRGLHDLFLTADGRRRIVLAAGCPTDNENDRFPIAYSLLHYELATGGRPRPSDRERHKVDALRYYAINRLLSPETDDAYGTGQYGRRN
jgi:hypothetical protein